MVEMLEIRGCGSVAPPPNGCLLVVSEIHTPVKIAVAKQ